MSKASNNENQKIESLEPMILMSASAAELGIDLDAANVIVASDLGESAVGTSGDDIIVGLGGDNCLHGGDGDDLLITTAGFNEVDGQGGTDTLRLFDGNRADYSIISNGNGVYQISNGERTDWVVNVEKFEFNDGVVMASDLLTGNTAPEITSNQHISTPENQIDVVTVEATDQDGDDLTFSLITVGDSALFNIDPDTGELTFKNAPDFENPSDDNGDNVYDVIVKVTDGKTTTLKTFWINVTDVNEGGGNQSPFFTNVADGEMILVDENTTLVRDTNAQDPDGDTLTYSISDGIGIPGSGNNEDAGAFNIDPNTGVLSFNVAPDFENPADADGDNQYVVTIVVTDGNGGAQERDVVVKVQNVNEGGGNQDPYFTNVSEGEMVTVNEGTRFVGDANGQDPDGDTVSFSIVGGDDAAEFSIDSATGVLSFVTTPDFENPADADNNNQYLVTLRVSDGNGGSQDRNVIVKVQDVQEGGGNQSPYFTNVSEGEMVTVPENTTAVGDANGVDPDGDAVTFSIVGGDDASLFSVDAQSGVVTFVNAPDFENPGDADNNNQYQITLRISDGKGGTQDRNVTVKVTDTVVEGGGNGSPYFTNVSEGEIVTVPENTTLVGDANAQDPDGDTVTFSIVGGVDASLFSVDAQTGVVTFVNAPDFENPGDADNNNNYQITLRVSDGNGGTQDRNVTVRVTDQSDTGGGNGSPYFTNVSEGEIVTVPENTTLVGDANAQDPDGDSVTFSIVGGADSSLFTVNAQTGVVSFIAAPDFENPGDADNNNNYQITLRVSDGNGGTQDRNVTVRVTDVGNEGGVGNRSPFFTNVSEGEIVTVPENTTPVGDANGIDPDGDDLTFSIIGGADSSLFTVNAQTGVVSFIAAPDFENPSDADNNNNYQITLRIADGKGGTQDRNVTVQVTDVGDEGGGGGNDAPFFTNVSQGEVVSVVTGNTFVGDADAVDPNGDQVTYSISGGTDAGLFTVNAQTGVVTFVNAPDVNNPGDADGNNLYQITLRASDGSLFQDRNVTVKVVNNGGGQQNRAPFFVNVEEGEFVWFDENRTFVGDANAIDLDGDALTFTVVGGADGALFTINPNTGQLFFLNAPDFENPNDTNGDNRYEVRIQVSDGQAFQERSVVVGVEDVNEGGNNGGGNGGGNGGQYNNFYPWLNNEFYFTRNNGVSYEKVDPHGDHYFKDGDDYYQIDPHDKDASHDGHHFKVGDDYYPVQP